ncbi:hypothetical protein HWV23_09615 [Natronomonas halophila]|uniref:DUF7093 family protein n=1 Tax=Natronomonas halophila TaxID=2747817 RepID=UPI0015B58BE1|nr:hypothetical protein [Natronomonas halophila]QLD85970.1 hypothetical protein HWV23_09615 [Natronomonas halophila]
MGLKCSILGHSFEPAGTETEREEQGSEVVTMVRELEECTRCGEERVVSETTEVTTVVDADEVDIDENATATDVDANAGAAAGGDTASGASEGGAFDAAVDRSGAEDAEIIEDDGDAEPDAAAEEAAEEAAAAVDELAESPDEEESTIEDRDPEEEDAVILTDDDEPDREPGEWPDDEDVVEAHEPAAEDGTADGEEPDPGPEPELEPEPSDNEDRLAGITVPEGTIVCPECEFTVDAESSYRDGDPCPECGAWLVEDDE